MKPDAACLEEFEDYILGYRDGIPKTPEWAAYYSGVPSYTIKALARHGNRPEGAAIASGSEDDLCDLVAKAESLRLDPLARPTRAAAALPAGFIGGTVYDYETDEVLEGAVVTISRATNGEAASAAGGGQDGLTLVTDGFGAFHVDGPDQGAYLISIERPGYQPGHWGPVPGGGEMTGYPLFTGVTG
jgi:hypothetical protein